MGIAGEVKDDGVTAPSILVQYCKPARAIYTNEDLASFGESECYKNLTGYIEALNDSVRDLKVSDVDPTSTTCCFNPNLPILMSMVEDFMGLIKEVPPSENKTRYGNAAFKQWHKLACESFESYYEKLSPNDELIKKDGVGASVEATEYLANAFGSPERIDYGTGHELNFIVFLYCLKQLGIFGEKDYSLVVLGVFHKYIELMYQLQNTYWIEPAGSHGVWGLDDYQFLPFYFGASQLYSHKHLKPKSIRSADFLEHFKDDYMYFKCIDNINKVKTETLSWHSPMLNDISAVKTWAKVNSGLMKMYKAEVLGKLPIMQHLKFGRLLRFISSAEQTLTLEEKNEIVHQEHHHSCCTIHVPSAAAVKATSNRMHGMIPFD